MVARGREERTDVWARRAALYRQRWQHQATRGAECAAFLRAVAALPRAKAGSRQARAQRAQQRAMGSFD